MKNVVDKLLKLKEEVTKLAKWERHGSVTMVNRDAHYQALASVKDHILRYVAKLVEGMKQEDVKHVPVANVELTVRKIMPDMYSGFVRRGSEVIHQFDRITIPQLAGQLQSLLELYDPDKVEDQAQPTKLLIEKLKPLAEKAENGMVSQLLAILSNQDLKPADPPQLDRKTEIANIIAEANAITEEAKNRMQRVDPRLEVQDLKERVEAMLHRVESIVSTLAPTSRDTDKFQDTLHQIQQKHDLLTDRVQQELNLLDDKIKEATARLEGKHGGAGKTITITVT